MARVEQSRPAQNPGDRRRESRRRVHEYRRFLRFSAIGTLIPGVGLIAAGRRRSGWFVLGLVLAGFAAVIVFTVRNGVSGLIDVGTDTRLLRVLGYGLMIVAILWLVTAVVSMRVLEPDHLNGGQRLLAALIVVLVGSLVVGPLALASRNSFAQRDLIGSVFADADEASLTVPEGPEEDPWADLPRVNVMLLGSDSGPGRDDTRTDTVMVASNDTTTGETILFALPRNLLNLPFPDGPLHQAYPEGFSGEPASEFWLSSVYLNVPAAHPEVFEGIQDPGAEALKLGVGAALGLDIHYYVMVNLRGFDSLVTALGGIDVDVPYRIPMGTKKSEVTGRCTEETGWIEPGENQHLNGYEALWFARARCGPGKVSDDYERMRRQRCVIGAIAEKADPIRLATSFQQIASATKDLVSTDIPQNRVGAFTELGLNVKNAGIRSLPFTDEIVNYEDPDYDEIRAYVAEALRPTPSAPASSSPSPSTSSPPPIGGAGSGSAGEPTDVPTAPSESEGAQELAAVC